ncbi:MAG: substrate-binding domain-containing protein [Sphaerochaetaceae bacterium]
MTIADIAKKAGVSIGTVDRVLHDRGRISPKTKERILKIIQDEGYRVNPVARQLKLNKHHVFGVLLPELDSEGGYWKLPYNGMAKAIAEFKPFSVSTELRVFKRDDPDSLMVAAKDLLSMDIEAMIMAPVLPQQTAAVLRMCGDLPYVFIDSPLPGFDPLVTLAQDPVKSGIVAGRLMDLLAPPPATYLAIQTYGNAYHSNERVRSFMEYFHGKEQVVVMREDCPEIDNPKVVDALLERLEIQAGRLSGIFVANDAVYHIAAAVERRYGSHRPAVLGFDLIKKNRSMLKNGTIDCLLSQLPEKQGYEAVNCLFRQVVLHEKSLIVQEMPIDIFIKENLFD